MTEKDTTRSIVAEVYARFEYNTHIRVEVSNQATEEEIQRELEEAASLAVAENCQTANELQRHHWFGQQRILTLASKKLISIRVDTEPDLVERKVQSLLTWLVHQKICWMSGLRRRRSRHDEWKVWHVEGAIKQIESVLADLCQTFPPRWQHSAARDGYGFQVFHCRDLIAGYAGTEIARQYWCGPQREQWYQEVAIVFLARAEQQQEEIFALTNHIDQPWPRHREVVWSLDMHALAARITPHDALPLLPPTGPVYPRSTSVGDVVVSLLSGGAWIVAPRGFQVVSCAESVVSSPEISSDDREPDGH